MQCKLIIDGNAVYEIDEECMERRQKRKEEWEQIFKRDRRGEATQTFRK